MEKSEVSESCEKNDALMKRKERENVDFCRTKTFMMFLTKPFSLKSFPLRSPLRSLSDWATVSPETISGDHPATISNFGAV